MENAMKQSNTEQPRRPEGQALRERWEHLRREAPIYWKAFQEWSRIHGRRAAHRVHNVVAGNRAAGPVSFLVCSAALAVALTLTTLYSPSYAVTLDGETVGVVADEGMVQQAIRSVEETGSQLLGYDYRVEGDLEYEFALSLRSDLTTPEELQNYFYNQLDAVSGELRKYQVLVDGQAVGVVKDEDSLNQLLDSMKDRYTTENTVSVRFLDTVATEPVYEVNDLMTIRERRGTLEGQKLCFIGDGCSMANSLIVGGLLAGMRVTCVCPEGYRPAADVLMFAHKYGEKFHLLTDPAEGVKDADVVVTAAWNTAPGTPESERRLRDFAGFQVTSRLMEGAKPDAMLLHCLPAHRGEEISNAVFEEHADEIFDEAENRLHVQKAVLAILLAGK